jgi:Zn-dependent protease with chaperone function
VIAPVLWLPVLVALLASVCAPALQRRLPPARSAIVLTAVAAGAAVAVLWGLALVAFGYVVQIPWVAELGGWCHLVLPSDDRVPAVFGLLSLAAVAIAAVRLLRWRRSMRRLMASLAVHDGPVEVLELDAPTAFAVPGDPGHIVVSRGMLDALDDEGRAVLFAHEQAHLDQRHHRLVRIAECAATVVPLLRPVLAAVHFATERSADEAAVEVVGDRVAVARAIARAALAGSASAPPLTLAMTSSTVPARVEALLAQPRSRPALTAVFAFGLFVLAAVVLVSATVQMHHFVMFARHLCRL